MCSVKEKISKEANDTSLIQNHLFGSEVSKKRGSETAFLDLFFMSPLCRHLHDHLLSAQIC